MMLRGVRWSLGPVSILVISLTISSYRHFCPRTYAHPFLAAFFFARACFRATIVNAYDLSNEQMSSPNSVWYTIFVGPVLIEHVEPGTQDHDCRLANDIAVPVSPIGSFVSVLNNLMPFELIPRNTCDADK